MKVPLFLILVLILLGATTACGAVGDSPENGAKEWLQALAKQDGLKLEDRTCSSQKQEQQREGMVFTTLMMFGESLTGVNLQDVKMELSDLEVTTIRTSGETAEVRVKGKLRAAIGLVVQSMEMDDTWLMTREEGKWKYCGSKAFRASDLPQMVLQDSDVPTGGWLAADLEQDFEEFLKDSVVAPDGEAKLREAGFQNSVYKRYEWTNDCDPARSLCAIASQAVLWNDAGGASEGLQVTCVEELKGMSPEWVASTDRKIKSVNGLGDEGYFEVIRSKTGEGGQQVRYCWRLRNMTFQVISYIESSGSSIEADLRPFVDKIQARAQ